MIDTATLPPAGVLRQGIASFAPADHLPTVIPLPLVGRMLKRILDVLVASTATLLLLPVLLVVATMVRLDSAGPVLFRQRRTGLGGRTFVMFKFRSMVDGAEALRGLVAELNEADGPLFKVTNDPRVTRLGVWLRRLSIDEIPQLLNVIRGEMSLVGPRPALPSEVETYDHHTALRLMVKPGITGPWQVSDRHRSSFEDYVAQDVDYVMRWSFRRDLVLLARTIPCVLGRTGA